MGTRQLTKRGFLLEPPAKCYYLHRGDCYLSQIRQHMFLKSADVEHHVTFLLLPSPGPAVIQKARCYCQMECQDAPLSNKLANPPYDIHNFAWKEVRRLYNRASGAAAQYGVQVTSSHCMFAHLPDKVPVLATCWPASPS